MSVWVVSGLVCATGIVALLIGGLVCGLRFRSAQRTFERTTAMSHRVDDGWETWFMDGFSRVAVGMQGLRALAVGIGWSVAGLGLIGIGLRLLR